MSKTRAKGTAFESEVVGYLKENGFEQAERNVLNSPLGDIKNIPIVAECKNHKTMTLSEWMKQAEVSGTKAGKLWAVVHKRRGKGVSKTWVTMELDQFTELLKAYDALNP
jgi:hypothetical protein